METALDLSSDFLIQLNDNIEIALYKLETNNCKTLIVINENNRVAGTVTDGDIRKALIAKRTLFTPISDVMNTDYYAVTVDNVKEADSIFNQFFYINLIPVIDAHGILQGILQRNR